MYCEIIIHRQNWIRSCEAMICEAVNAQNLNVFSKYGRELLGHASYCDGWHGIYKKRLGHKQQIVPLANLTWRLNGQHQLMSNPHLSIFSRPMQFWERARAEGKAVGQFHPIQEKIPFPIARRSKSKDKHRFSPWTLMTVAAWRSFNFTSDWFHSYFPNCSIGTGGWSMTQKSTANEGASDVIWVSSLISRLLWPKAKPKTSRFAHSTSIRAFHHCYGCSNVFEFEWRDLRTWQTPFSRSMTDPPNMPSFTWAREECLTKQCS